MTLIILLIALMLERIVARSPAWQFSGYFSSWIKSETFSRTEESQGVGFWLWLLMPSIVLGLVLWASDSFLVTFIVETFVLLVCLGCATLRKQYKRYLNAASRKDAQACFHYAQSLGCDAAMTCAKQSNASLEDEATESETVANEEVKSEDAFVADAKLDNMEHIGDHVAKQLISINFSHYCAVMFWFVFTGGAGAVAYCSIREYAARNQCSDTNSANGKVNKILHILNWLPARLMSFGLLVVGNYSKGLKVWLSYSGDFKTPASKVIEDVASAADCIEEESCGYISAPSRFVVLAKRNILFFLLVVALLTLFVGLR